VDAALATVIIAALSLVMVIGVQGFDALEALGGGTAVLPLDALFNGIAAHPSAPEYWWLYALLLSTMIPSLINLVIGGTSLVRGLPWVPFLLLRNIPERGGVLRWDRHWIATFLTAQVAAGAAGIPSRGNHRRRHAVFRPGIAQHGPRSRRLQSAGAGGAALRGQPIAKGAGADRRLPAGEVKLALRG
jgi:hypothetical protein